MDRRVFFRILSATSAGALGTGCGTSPGRLMPLLIPEHEILPGEEQWHPAACTACPAGCGTLVRVMEGVRVIEQNGEKVQQRIAAIKKIEGNPLDPVSGGRLCARGQAEVQGLYHPDRLRGPMKRSGARGRGDFTPISWDEAIAVAAASLAKVSREDPRKLAVLTGPGAGTHSLALERFAQALHAPPPVICSLGANHLERKAAELVFGWKGLPVYDLAHARILLGVGSDFLGGGPSPVFYARQYGAFRRGRKDLRGQFMHAESRLSLTAASADRWLPIQPGSEAAFLAATGRALIDAKLAKNLAAVPKSVADVFHSANVKTLLGGCGVEERHVREVVQELGESEAPLVFAGASSVHTNSLEALIAGHYLNVMLGVVGKSGGVLPPPTQTLAEPENERAAEALQNARAVLLVGANPAYTLPRASGVLEVLEKAETVISFSSFLDDSAAWSDLILPEHHALEAGFAMIPAVSQQSAVTVAVPFVEPLYETRPLDAIFTALAGKIGATYGETTLEDALGKLPEDASVEDIAHQGGYWPAAKSSASPAAARPAARVPDLSSAVFDGDAGQYPFAFQPYASVQHHEGSGAHLPWMQELPDPASSSIWGLPVEVDPKTAAALRISNGDMVRVESRHGKLEAPAYVHPGAIPGVLSMAIGGGHSHYGRYASGLGANPVSILAPVWEKTTGALAMGATRVRLTRISGRDGWIQFAAPDREERDQHR